MHEVVQMNVVEGGEHFLRDAPNIILQEAIVRFFGEQLFEQLIATAKLHHDR